MLGASCSSCCEVSFCFCSQPCHIGIQFVDPQEIDIGVCTPRCDLGFNAPCNNVINTVYDQGDSSTAAGRVTISYATTAGSFGVSASTVKRYVRLMTTAGSQSVHASVRYNFIYQCSNTSSEPVLTTERFLELNHVFGHQNTYQNSLRIGLRRIEQYRTIAILKPQYKCSAAAGRLCINLGLSYTQEFVPQHARWRATNAGVSGFPYFNYSNPLQLGDQTLIQEVYDAQFSPFEPLVVFSEQNTCNPLP